MSTTVLPAVSDQPPAWVVEFVSHLPHPPDLDTWTCRTCPDSQPYPCPAARLHLADWAAVAPASGLLWLRWCYAQARVSQSDTEAAPLRARILGWYEAVLERVRAYQTRRPNPSRW